MATVQQMQCDVCGQTFESDGTVRRFRFEVHGPIVRTKQPLGKPEDGKEIEASHIDHDGDLLIDDACETCRDEIRKALVKLKAKMTEKAVEQPKAKAKRG